MKWGQKQGILTVVGNDSQGYKLSCCTISFGSLSFGLGFFSFVQIYFGHAVRMEQSLARGRKLLTA